MISCALLFQDTNLVCLEHGELGAGISSTEVRVVAMCVLVRVLEGERAGRHAQHENCTREHDAGTDELKTRITTTKITKLP